MQTIDNDMAHHTPSFVTDSPDEYVDESCESFGEYPGRVYHVVYPIRTMHGTSMMVRWRVLASLGFESPDTL